MKTLASRLGLVLIFIGMVSMVHGQTGPPASGPGPGGCFPPPCIPIDGGISILIAAGLGLAGKKAYDHHKHQGR